MSTARAGRRRAPLALVLPALLTVALLLLPLAYLVVRATGGGSAWQILWRRDTLELVLSTGLLVAGVTAASVAIGVPLAWLTVRTDLPGRRAWAVAATLPLVDSELRRRASASSGRFGPRGLLQQLPRRRALPEIYGYWGALLALTLSTYPYVLLLTSAALRGLDPSLEEAARGLGRSGLDGLPAGDAAGVAALDRRGSAPRRALSLSDFGVVSLMRYDALTRAIYLQYRSLFDRTPAAVLALVLVALTVLVLVARGTLAPADEPKLSRRRPAARAHTAWGAGSCRRSSTARPSSAPSSSFPPWCSDTGSCVGSTGPKCRSERQLNSLSASALAAGVAALAALPVALLAHRWPSRWTRCSSGSPSPATRCPES